MRAADFGDPSLVPDILQIRFAAIPGTVLSVLFVYAADSYHDAVGPPGYLQGLAYVRVAQQAVSHRCLRHEHGRVQVVRVRLPHVRQERGHGYAVELGYAAPYAAHQLDHGDVPLLPQEPAAHDVMDATAPAEAHDVALAGVLL